jgi:hypothetical protein
MAEAISPGDPKRREKLKKMIDTMDDDGMKSVENMIVNQGGGVSNVYREFGDVDKSAIDPTETYAPDAKTTHYKDLTASPEEWANLLVEMANKGGTEPPATFMWRGGLYSLETRTDPVFERQRNPRYSPAPRPQPGRPSSQPPSREPEFIDVQTGTEYAVGAVNKNVF